MTGPLRGVLRIYLDLEGVGIVENETEEKMQYEATSAPTCKKNLK